MIGAGRANIRLRRITDNPDMTPARVKASLSQHEELAHVTVEIHQCTDPLHP